MSSAQPVDANTLTPGVGDPMLRMHEISKSFGGAKALTSVTLELFGGEVHALLGENGAGKSTLMKILFGVVSPDSGDIILKGLGQTVLTSPRDALALGIGLVSQEPSLVPQLSVAQNIFLGQASLASLVARQRMRADAISMLQELAPGISVDAPVSTLKMAERQVVEIARALARGGRIIAFDEPTSSLTTAERDRLFSIIADLKRSGKAIIYISHRMPEIQEIADRVTVLRDGRVVATGPIADFSTSQLNELIAGRQLNEEFGKAPAIGSKTSQEILLLDRVSTLTIRDVSFTIRRGEIMGLCGLVGSGRTEVARAIFGLDPVIAGKMLVDGHDYSPRSVADSIRAGVALIPEDRRGQAMIPLMDVEQNFGLGNERVFGRFGLLKGRYRKRETNRYIERLNIRPARASAQIRDLSGGNQQKVIMARWLQSGARIFIFDEPTRGVDVGAKSEIHAILRGLAEEGAAVLVISSDLPELMSLSHRIGVMRGGTCTGTLENGPGLTEEKLIAYAAGEISL